MTLSSSDFSTIYRMNNTNENTINIIQNLQEPNIFGVTIKKIPPKIKFFWHQLANTFIKLMDKPTSNWTRELQENKNNNVVSITNNIHQTNMFDFTYFKK